MERFRPERDAAVDGVGKHRGLLVAEVAVVGEDEHRIGRGFGVDNRVAVLVELYHGPVAGHVVEIGRAHV